MQDNIAGEFELDCPVAIDGSEGKIFKVESTVLGIIFSGTEYGWEDLKDIVTVCLISEDEGRKTDGEKVLEEGLVNIASSV